MLFIGKVGAVSIVKAVCLDGRFLHCACMCGGFESLLGPVYLADDCAIMALRLWRSPASSDARLRVRPARAIEPPTVRGTHGRSA
jgi:hypothetical protein